ncbi:MAG: GlsB/YeaQ/YmgE family stress response membrane protein [Ardenticatenaceae bacterium]|nr:GlsB/YeaQ/YmgE family stress response membrane protein [Ardenticatenaceae bacterium]MCB8949567.1 GlsB/YeaQ/YmgE family stress response membrane protein [Ardenticatenaceae bacterium]
MLVNIILWIILGAAAGWIASIIMKRDAQMGALANIIVGIVGAVLGGFLFNTLGLAGDTGFNLWTLFVAIIGSVVLLFLIGVVRRAA